MEKCSALALVASLIACSSTGDGRRASANISKTLPPDIRGVRLAGGETSDLGGGEGLPDPCRDVETTRFSLEEARQHGLPIEAKVAFLQTAYEAPFRWGYECGDPSDRRATALEPAGDTRLRVQGQVVDVLRTTRTPLPGQPQERECADRLDYRSVFDLSTADGLVSGRFYARLPHPFETGLMRAWPDLQNFTGSLAVPIDPARPHWARLLVDLGLGDDGSLYGSLDTFVNYTDGAPGGGSYGIGGFVLSEDGEPRAHAGGLGLCGQPAAVPAAAEPQSLSIYDGSGEAPSCAVAVSYYVSELYLNAPDPSDVGFVARDGQVLVEVDGVAVAVGAGIPQPLGRLPAGTHIHVEMSSGVPGTMPFIGLSLGRGGSFVSVSDVFSFCEEPGCVAVADGVVDGCLN